MNLFGEGSSSDYTKHRAKQKFLFWLVIVLSVTVFLANICAIVFFIAHFLT